MSPFRSGPEIDDADRLNTRRASNPIDVLDAVGFVLQLGLQLVETIVPVATVGIQLTQLFVAELEYALAIFQLLLQDVLPLRLQQSPHLAGLIFATLGQLLGSFLGILQSALLKMREQFFDVAADRVPQSCFDSFVGRSA